MILLKILEFIKKNFFNFLILILVAIILLQRCGNGGGDNSSQKPTIVRDTVWVKTNNTVITQPTIVKTIPGIPGKEYIPNPNYDKLVLQYQALVKDYIAKNIHKDSIKIDSLGYVKIEDKVSKNLIVGRKTSYSLRYPIITNTITVPQEQRNQVYFGGGLEGNQSQIINQFNAGLLLKTKSDKIYNVYGGVDLNGQLNVGLQAYWKIKLHK